MGVREQYSVIHRTNYFESLVHLLKVNIGAGIFAMGQALKNAGLLFGFGLTLILGTICTYNNHVLIASSEHVKIIGNLDAMPNYPETLEYCFKHGPPFFSKRTRAIRIIVKCFIMSTQLGFCSIYLLFVATSIRKIVTNQMESMPHDLRLYVLLIAIPALCTGQVRHFKFLAPFALVADVFLFFGLIGTIVMCSLNGYPPISERAAIADWRTWPIFIGTVMFAFEGIAVIIPLHNEMKNPRLFTAPYGVVNVGMSTVVLCTAVIGFISYLRYGDDIKEIVTLNLDKGIIAEMIKASVAIAIMLSYAIQFHVAVDVSWWDIVASKHVKRVVLYEHLYRVALSLVTIITAVAVPYLGLFLSLIGSCFSTSLALTFPALCDISLRTNPDLDKRLKAGNKCFQVLRFIMDGVTLLTALVGFLTGSTTSFVALYHAFRENPYGEY